jgi:hypothetical protein
MRNCGSESTRTVMVALPEVIGTNDIGQMVGSFVDSTGTHGFLETNGLFTLRASLFTHFVDLAEDFFTRPRWNRTLWLSETVLLTRISKISSLKEINDLAEVNVTGGNPTLQTLHEQQTQGVWVF